ncbi:MAG: hypothetical protein PHQ22_09130 [Sulfuricurvum sp.]|nr:hypothetical protein [Sulfuricurvum sp.]
MNKISTRTFTLLFGPDEQDKPIILHETPSEDALFLDPHPIVISCNEDEEGELAISNVEYDQEAFEEKRKVEKLFEILNYSFDAEDLTNEDDPDTYLDVPTFMLQPRKYPDDYTYHCMKCKTEFISFSLRYTQYKYAIMCPECHTLHWVNFDDATYRIPDEITRFESYLKMELSRYDTLEMLPLPEKYIIHRKLLSYLIGHSLYSPEFIERYMAKGWSNENMCYRTIEALMIEQLCYFLIEQEGGWRERILRDLRIHREMNKIKKFINVT